MIGAIIQARMGSTRLPGKVLKKIAKKPLLWHVIDRLKKATLIDSIVLATSDQKIDKPVYELAVNSGINGYAGSEIDVLDRYYQAATAFNLEIVVRITADCPLLDPQIVGEVVSCYLNGDYDYVANTLELSYPDGLDVEVFSYSALKQAWKEAKLVSEREHVTPYIWKHPDIFKLNNVRNSVDISHYRWSVDESRDLQFVREIYKRLYRENQFFDMKDILKLLENHPELVKINQGIAINEGYAKSIKEDTIIS